MAGTYPLDLPVSLLVGIKTSVASGKRSRRPWSSVSKQRLPTKRRFVGSLSPRPAHLCTHIHVVLRWYTEIPTFH